MVKEHDHAIYQKDLLRLTLEQVKASDFCDEYEAFDPTVIQRAAKIPLGPSAAVYIFTEFIQRVSLDEITDDNARTRFNDVTACMFKLGQVALGIHKTFLTQE